MPSFYTESLSFEPEMILIPTGRFLMGSDPQRAQGAPLTELPQHILYLPDYYLAKTLVTNAQYAAFVQATGHPVPRTVLTWDKESTNWSEQAPPQTKETHPVANVSWHDALAYCHWLAEITGKPYCLPSEAEWEKAARGGFFLDGDSIAQTPNPNPRRIYPWGDTFDSRRCNVYESAIHGTTSVTHYPTGRTPYGVMDMIGNVWEWTRSLFGPYPYNPANGRESLMADGPRVVRGGSWNYSQRFVRCSSRDYGHPDRINEFLGFRVALSLGSPSV